MCVNYWPGGCKFEYIENRNNGDYKNWFSTNLKNEFIAFSGYEDIYLKIYI